MDEPSLRDTLTAAMDTAGDTPPADPPPADTPPADTPPADTPPAKVGDDPEGEGDAADKAAGKSVVDHAPASWKGDAKQVWADLPEAARAEVMRREQHINKVLSDTAPARQVFDQVSEVAGRYRDRIAEWGVPIPQVLDNLLSADRLLSAGSPEDRAKYMAELISEYSIDIKALDEALVTRSKIPNVDKQVQALLDRELAPFKLRAQQEEQQTREQVAGEVSAMEADTVNYPHFDLVREDMADLIELRAKRGVYVSLKQAYSLLTSGNERVSEVNAEKQRQEKIKADAAVAAKAKAAAGSISGVPGSVSSGVDATNLRATIEHAMGSSEGRV